MAILVCGGAGYIGSHTVARLIEKKGKEVVVFDNLQKGHKEAVPENVALYVGGDLRDPEALDKVFGRIILRRLLILPQILL